MHIGSTAIKGAVSVPVIDILLVVKDDNLKEITCAILEDMGYVENGNVFLKESTDISYSLRLLNIKNEDEYVKYTSVVRYLENNKDSLGELPRLVEVGASCLNLHCSGHP